MDLGCHYRIPLSSSAIEKEKIGLEHHSHCHMDAYLEDERCTSMNN